MSPALPNLSTFCCKITFMTSPTISVQRNVEIYHTVGWKRRKPPATLKNFYKGRQRSYLEALPEHPLDARRVRSKTEFLVEAITAGIGIQRYQRYVIGIYLF